MDASVHMDVLGAVIRLMVMSREASDPRVSVAACMLAMDLRRLSGKPDDSGLRRQAARSRDVLRFVVGRPLSGR